MLLCTTNQSRPRKVDFILFALTLFFVPLLAQNKSLLAVGSARGEAEANFEIYPKSSEIVIPSIAINGFLQNSTKTPFGISVKIKINADSLRIEKEFHLSKTAEKQLKRFDNIRAPILIDWLSKTRYLDEATLVVFNFLKSNWHYVDKNDNDLSIEALLNSKDASCLSFCRLAKEYMNIIGIQSDIVVGIKFPIEKETFILEKGALHSWLKLKIDDTNDVFCDPLSFFGFVTPRYIYIADWETFKKDKLRHFKDSTVTLTSCKDRIFFNPESEVKPQFWERSPYENSVYGLVLGKVLKEKDIPVSGEIVIKSAGNDFKTELFQGNFYFFVKTDGEYSIYFVTEGKKEKKLGDVTFSGCAVKKVVFYYKENI